MHFAPFLFYLELDRVFVMIISTFTLLVWLVIESFTLCDALQFRNCIEKYPFIQVKFLCTNLFLCLV